MKLRLFSLNISAALISVLMISCSGGIIIPGGEWDARFRTAVHNLSSTRWTDRVEAVKVPNEYLSIVRELDYVYGSSVPEYIKLSEIIIFEASSDVHRAVRLEAVKGLGLLETRGALKKLRYMASEDKEQDVRWKALESLALYKDPGSAGIFVRAYESEDWLIREAAIKGLLKINDKEVLEEYIQVIKKALNDPANRVRIAALENLNFTDDRLYGDISLNLLEEKTYRNRAKAALKALDGYRLDDDLRTFIIDEYLTHNNPELRVAAFRVLKSDRALSGDK